MQRCIIVCSLIGVLSWHTVQSAVREASMQEIMASQDEYFVAIFYDQASSESEAALEIAMNLDTYEDTGFKFVECDISKPHNMKLADEAKLISPPHIFVNTPYEGVIEFKGPVEEGELLSFLDRLQIVPDHAAIKVVEKRQQFDEYIENGAFVKFMTKGCAHCWKMKRSFGQAAALLKEKYHFAFVEVDCGMNQETKDICEDEGVHEVPTLALYKGEGENVIYFEGSFAVSEYEEFFKQQMATEKVPEPRKLPPQMEYEVTTSDQEFDVDMVDHFQGDFTEVESLIQHLIMLEERIQILEQEVEYLKRDKKRK